MWADLWIFGRTCVYVILASWVKAALGLSIFNHVTSACEPGRSSKTAHSARWSDAYRSHGSPVSPMSASVGMRHRRSSRNRGSCENLRRHTDVRAASTRETVTQRMHKDLCKVHACRAATWRAFPLQACKAFSLVSAAGCDRTR